MHFCISTSLIIIGYRTGWHYDVDGDLSVEANTQTNTDDPWYQFVYDARWRIVATYRASHYSGWTIDTNPKEQFVYNMAGVAGGGGSSYIDSVILRDRDANTAWEAAADSVLEERVYYCQNWRADVVALFSDAGQLINQLRYDPYGVPFGISKADVNADGCVDTSDITRFGSIWNGGSGTHPLADWNFDGAVNTADYTAYLNDNATDTALGRGNVSYNHTHLGGDSRKAYAGYEIDPVLADADTTTGKQWLGFYHVRHRVYISHLGRWIRRDPMGYVGSLGQYQYLQRTLVLQDPTGLRPCSNGTGCGNDNPPTSGEPNPKVPPVSIDPRLPGSPDVWKCNSYIAQILSTDQIAMDLWQQLMVCAANTPGFTMPSIKCDSSLPSNVYGWYDCRKKQLRMNPIHGIPYQEYVFTIRHELSHALDDCRAGGGCSFTHNDDGSTNCTKMACTEIRAYNISGECCNSMSELGISYCECIRSGALASLSGTSCSDNSDAYVENAMRNGCFNPDDSPCPNKANKCPDIYTIRVL